MNGVSFSDIVGANNGLVGWTAVYGNDGYNISEVHFRSDGSVWLMAKGGGDVSYTLMFDGKDDVSYLENGGFITENGVRVIPPQGSRGGTPT